MPFIPHTPESLIPRSDSKNPSTTCKGLTSSGRPCRRALAASSVSSPNSNRSARDGVLAVLPSDEDHHEGAAAFFCWQHKDQAAVLAAGDHGGREANVVQLRDRTSVDTLVDRLGILEINEDLAMPKRPRRKQEPRPARKETLPKNWRDVPGPLIAVSEKASSSEKPSRHQPNSRRPKGQSNLLLSLLCCVRTAEPKHPSPPPVRHQKNEVSETIVQTARIPSYLQPNTPTTPTPAQRRKNQSSPSRKLADLSPINNPTTSTNRPAFPREPSSQTQSLLSLIPNSLSPQTTSLLLAELAKPISPYDEEGFIYIFWLTPSESPTPTAEATSSLLPPSARPTPSDRRTSELVREYAPKSTRSAGQSTVLLKIGRASNVQRRMNEWSRQCNHNLSLIRYYPHPSSPSSQQSSPITAQKSSKTPQAAIPLKVPNAHKVERLIHLELAAMRVRKVCAVCGKEHREWFEVDGSREGVCGVDAVVKRWVGWNLGMDRR